jgi:hypothetical protein
MTIEDLKYVTKSGEVGYLPMWYLTGTPEEVEEAKAVVINAKPTTFDLSETVIPETVIDDREFTTEEFQEIEAMIACGLTFDSACQRQIQLEIMNGRC